MTTNNEQKRASQNQHPMAEAYLADLDRALSSSDPHERAETMSAVREHLADAVTPDATAEQVRRVLDELGPVEVIAASTTQSAPSPTPERGGIDGLAISSIIAAVAGMLLLVPAPFIGVPLALIALIAGIVHLRSARRGRSLAWSAVAVAALTLTMAIVAAMTLLASSNSLKPQQPRSVESTQQSSY